MRFTDRTIKSLRPKAQRYEVWEDGQTGLGVRVTPKGARTWVFMYRFDGKARRMTLGTYPSIGVAQAHVLHAKAREALDQGIDPGVRHVAQRRAEREARRCRGFDFGRARPPGAGGSSRRSTYSDQHPRRGRMSEASKAFEPWKGFEKNTLPESLAVPSPQRAGLVAKMLVSVFFLFALAALLAPWTQNIRGRGRVVGHGSP